MPLIEHIFMLSKKKLEGQDAIPYDETLSDVQFFSTASGLDPVTMYLFSPSLLQTWNVFPK